MKNAWIRNVLMRIAMRSAASVRKPNSRKNPQSPEPSSCVLALLGR